jgi:hypothetical protein
MKTRSFHKFNGQQIAEDTSDVVSMRHVVSLIQDDCERLSADLDAMSDDASLPTWLTNMLAVSQSDVASAREYLVMAAKKK